MKVTTALFAATLTVFAVECGNGDAGMDEMETMEDEAGMMEEGMDTADTSGMMDDEMGGEMEGGMEEEMEGEMEGGMEEGMPEEMMDDTMEMSGPDGMSGGG